MAPTVYGISHWTNSVKNIMVPWAISQICTENEGTLWKSHKEGIGMPYSEKGDAMKQFSEAQRSGPLSRIKPLNFNIFQLWVVVGISIRNQFK